MEYTGSIDKLERLILNNFRDNAHSVICTYKNEVQPDDYAVAARDAKNYIKLLQRKLIRAEIEYAAVTEQLESGNWVHRIILFDIPNCNDIIQSEWMWGFANCEEVYGIEDCRKCVAYMKKNRQARWTTNLRAAPERSKVVRKRVEEVRAAVERLCQALEWERQPMYVDNATADELIRLRRNPIEFAKTQKQEITHDTENH